MLLLCQENVCAPMPVGAGAQGILDNQSYDDYLFWKEKLYLRIYANEEFLELP